MGFVQTDATVRVDMEVARYREFPEDGMVELWGHVGDYEVCVHMPLDDERVRQLLGPAPREGGRRARPEER